MEQSSFWNNCYWKVCEKRERKYGFVIDYAGRNFYLH